MPPTCEEIWNEKLELIEEATRHGYWRYGSEVKEVYKRDDGTYWSVGYRRSTDGETNELRDGLATIFQVWPKTRAVTVYEDKPD